LRSIFEKIHEFVGSIVQCVTNFLHFLIHSSRWITENKSLAQDVIKLRAFAAQVFLYNLAYFLDGALLAWTYLSSELQNESFTELSVRARGIVGTLECHP